MGLKFKDLIAHKKEISIPNLKGKILAVDAMNMLYQFLTTIRGPGGEALTDKNGAVTSHLIGLFFRAASLMEEGLKLVFVFDGTPPEIKKKTWQKRAEIKKEAALKLKEAEETGDLLQMKKFASRTSVLTKEMVEDAKKLIAALGLPIVQAPSEGEAQTAYMVKKGDAYASISQDYDNLIFGCSKLIRNLSIEGRRKKTGTLGYQIVKPELIVLEEVLRDLNITQEQLIMLAILIGTDYNPGGVNGIGPKKALKLLHEYNFDYEKMFSVAKWDENFPDLGWKEIYRTIKEIPVTDKYVLEWKKPKEQELFNILVHNHNFNEERVKNKLEKIKEKQEQTTQKGLAGFFGK